MSSAVDTFLQGLVYLELCPGLTSSASELLLLCQLMTYFCSPVYILKDLDFLLLVSSVLVCCQNGCDL